MNRRKGRLLVNKIKKGWMILNESYSKKRG